MDLTLRFAFSLCVIAQLSGLTSGHPTFRAQIPNGYQVPHPCNPQYIWSGVGHDWYKGTGSRNPFGLAWKNNGFKWDSTLCEADSDEDGKSNGEELGDPDCTWTPGSQPNSTTGLSHPGICEPLNSPICRQKNPSINCTDLCYGLFEGGVFRHTVRLTPPVDVPSKQMVHKCMVFDFPDDDDYHLVSLTANAVNIPVLKHITVFGCAGDSYPEAPGTIHDCYMNGECGTILFHWTAGDSDICLNPEAGIRVGNQTTGFKRGLIELHLYSDTDGVVQDSSGVDFFLTPNRRPNDAAMLMFGQTFLNIPPHEEDYVVTGGCSATCTAQKMTGPINVIAAFSHMHYRGVSGMAYYVVNEKRAHYTAYDATYSYDHPTYQNFPFAKVINPGDRLTAVCHYNTTSSNRTYHYGSDTYENEMCYSLIMFYPRENLSMSVCQSFGSLDTCDIEGSIIQGCDTLKLDYSDVNNVPEYNNVLEYCKPGVCLIECRSLLHRVKKHPCYSGSMRNRLLMQIESASGMAKSNMLAFWLRMSSCDKEFSMDMCETTNAATVAYVRMGVLLLSVGMVTVFNFFF